MLVFIDSSPWRNREAVTEEPSQRNMAFYSVSLRPDACVWTQCCLTNIHIKQVCVYVCLIKRECKTEFVVGVCDEFTCGRCMCV